MSLPADDLFYGYIKPGGLQNSPVASRHYEKEKKRIFFLSKKIVHGLNSKFIKIIEFFPVHFTRIFL
jgi:hypothetical protein